MLFFHLKKMIHTRIYIYLMQKQETGNGDRLAGQSSDNLQEIDEEQLGAFRSLVRSFVRSFVRFYLGVSKNRGTPKWMVYNGKTLLKWMIWGYHYFRKHPFTCVPCAFLEDHPMTRK